MPTPQSPLRVASVQMESLPADKAANLRTIARFVEQASAQGARLVLFPECCITGDSIRISCIGYRTLVLRHLAPGKPLEIRLQSHVISLEALTVKPPQPQQLIREAVAALSRNNTAPPLQLRGFYREVIRKEKTYYSVAEAVLESQLPRRGDDEALLKLVQGRRSESVTATRIFEDYHPGGGPNYLVNHLLEAQVPPFLQSGEFDEYTYAIDSITSYEGRDVYIIGFD